MARERPRKASAAEQRADERPQVGDEAVVAGHQLYSCPAVEVH